MRLSGCGTEGEREMSHWNYRVMRTPTGNADEPFFFAIHEVYYDDSGKPNGWTENAVGVCSDTVEGLRDVLAMFAAALEKPPIDVPTVTDKLFETETIRKAQEK